MKPFKKKSRSAAETKKIAGALARHLAAGDVVALSGELGSGKTTFAKGLAKGLGVRTEREVSSPTFVLIHEYSGRLPVFHLDWYRLEKVEGADRDMAEECFDAPGVTLVEWPERGRALLPRERIEVRLKHAGQGRRAIEIRVLGKKSKDFQWK
jgi:tRNA threonylcarbamoyladenosine biosynthesis protein TsaE